MFVIGGDSRKFRANISPIQIKKAWICGSNLSWLLNFSSTFGTMLKGLGSGMLISIARKNQLVSFDH